MKASTAFIEALKAQGVYVDELISKGIFRSFIGFKSSLKTSWSSTTLTYALQTICDNLQSFTYIGSAATLEA